MLDGNGRIERNLNGISGKYSCHRKSDEVGKLLIDTANTFELFAVSTDFKPRGGIGKKRGKGTRV